MSTELALLPQTSLQLLGGMTQTSIVPIPVPGQLVGMTPTADPEVEAFLTTNPVDQGTGFRFRALPLNLQRLVMMRGSLVGTRDPSAVLMSRVRDAIQSGGSNVGGMGAPQPPPAQLSSPEVEAFIATNPVDFQAASRLRALPPHLQRHVLMRGTLSGVRDSSSVLMSRVRDALASGSAPPPAAGGLIGVTGVAPLPPPPQQPPSFR